jgi:hypothetical protein
MQEAVEKAFPGWVITGETYQCNRWAQNESFNLRIAKDDSSPWRVSDVRGKFPDAEASTLPVARDLFFAQVQDALTKTLSTFHAEKPAIPDPGLGPQWVHKDGAWHLPFSAGQLHVTYAAPDWWKATWDTDLFGDSCHGSTPQLALEELQDRLECDLADLVNEKDAISAALEVLCSNK